MRYVASCTLLWTYLDLQGKLHLLIPEIIPPPLDPHPFPFPNTPVCTGPSARSLDASGMPRLTIVLICGTFVLTFCGTYCGLILICLLIQWLDAYWLNDWLFPCYCSKVQKRTLWYHSLLMAYWYLGGADRPEKIAYWSYLLLTNP
jgi:hypothetical protein